MATTSGTWKAAERRIATFFGTTRTPLSGGNGKQTRSDSLHRGLFLEAKLRVKHGAITLWRETKVLADKENKIPVICLNEKGKEGFWIMCHSSDFIKVGEMVQGVGYICQGCAIHRKGVWPEGLLATCHPGTCPDCGEQAGLVSVGDWDWPDGSDKPFFSAGRD
jgi:hypothetical protein